MARLYERKKKNGKIVYCAHVCINGQRIHQSFDSEKGFTKKDRDDWVKKIEYEHRVQLRTIARKKTSLNKLIDKYIEEELPFKKSKRSMIVFIEYWKNCMGHFNLNEIKPHHIHTHCQKKATSPATYNRYLAHMSILMSYAYFQDMIDDNPCKKVKKKREKPRHRFLSTEELQRLLKETKEVQHLHLIVLIALTTGCRKGEILGMRWKRYDKEEGSIYIPDTKNGDPKTVYVNHVVKPFLDEWEKVRPDSARIFPYGDFKRSWWSALKRAKIKDFHFHDLRHTFATYLLGAGVSQFDVMKALGHRNLNSLKVYAHISKERLREVYRAIDGALDI